jgi:hypothetical protein
MSRRKTFQHSQEPDHERLAGHLIDAWAKVSAEKVGMWAHASALTEVFDALGVPIKVIDKGHYLEIPNEYKDYDAEQAAVLNVNRINFCLMLSDAARAEKQEIISEILRKMTFDFYGENAPDITALYKPPAR